MRKAYPSSALRAPSPARGEGTVMRGHCKYLLLASRWQAVKFVGVGEQVYSLPGL